MNLTTNPLTRLWNLVREQKADITAIYFFAGVGALIQLTLPVGIQAIIGFVMAGSLSASLIILITILVLAVALNGILQMNQMKVIERVQQRIFVRYSFAFADRIPRLDLKKVDGFYLPELVNRFFDITTIQKNIAKLLLEMPTALIQILFGLILLSFYHSFFILFGVMLIILLWLMVYATGSRGLQTSLTESSYKYGLAGWFEEMARMSKTFKVAQPVGLHMRKTNDRSIQYLNARTRHFGVLLFQYKSVVLLKIAITGAMLIAGVVLLLEQRINIGQFVAVEIIIITVISAIEKIIINLDSVYDVLTAVEKVSKLTDKPIEASGSHPLDKTKPVGLVAKSLQFEYADSRRIIKDLSFNITPGEKVAVCGPEGAGKTTLLKLLTGIYQDFSGSLNINGMPIGRLALDSLRSQTGILFPAENIFHGTLWENLTMGREDIDSAYVALLVQKTGLQSFLDSSISGYDTELDPTGKKLPRNVIQKILVIRALAHRPTLVILEEPWQSIEQHFSAQIRDMILHLENTTVIVATNDADYQEGCNQIIQLKD